MNAQSNDERCTPWFTFKDGHLPSRVGVYEGSAYDLLGFETARRSMGWYISPKLSVKREHSQAAHQAGQLCSESRSTTVAALFTVPGSKIYEEDRTLSGELRPTA